MIYPSSPGIAEVGLVELLEEARDVLDRSTPARNRTLSLLSRPKVTSRPRICRKRSRRSGGRQDQEDAVHRLAIDRVEGDRGTKETRHPDEPLREARLTMGEDDPISQGRRPQFLPLVEEANEPVLRRLEDVSPCYGMAEPFSRSR